MTKKLSSLKKLSTLAVMIEVRSKLIEEINKVVTNDLSFHIKKDSIIHRKNFKLLFHLQENLDTIRQHLNKKVDDNARWMKILENVYEEVDHFRILLDTTFDEHLSEYHAESLCSCWKTTATLLLREFSSIRQRLFGPF